LNRRNSRLSSSKKKLRIRNSLSDSLNRLFKIEKMRLRRLRDLSQKEKPRLLISKRNSLRLMLQSQSHL